MFNTSGRDGASQGERPIALSLSGSQMWQGAKRQAGRGAAKMESEIKLAWESGYRAALKIYTELDDAKIECMVAEAWQQAEFTIVNVKPTKGEQLSIENWNTKRIQHRDEN